ncbi:hypothetical protein AB0N09_42105 [Streptomyces erythrochromogenes]|uniref:hypothetical protein n=1 Tax=Streptomyces erythrochromogenes TaxID=285574 RepID=UPI00343E41B7
MHILFGYGTLEDVDFTVPQTVGVPEGYRIDLCVPKGHGAFHHNAGTEFLDGFNPAGSITPVSDAANLALYSGPGLDDPHLVASLGSYSPIRPGIEAGDPIRLCDANPGPCPVSQEQVAEGVEHNCGGILGDPRFRGVDLIWAAIEPTDPLGYIESTGAEAAYPTPMELMAGTVQFPEYFTEKFSEAFNYETRYKLLAYEDHPTELPSEWLPTRMFKHYCYLYWEASGKKSTHENVELFEQLPFVREDYRGVTQLMVADGNVMRGIYQDFLDNFNMLLPQAQIAKMLQPGYDSQVDQYWEKEIAADFATFVARDEAPPGRVIDQATKAEKNETPRVRKAPVALRHDTRSQVAYCHHYVTDPAGQELLRALLDPAIFPHVRAVAEMKDPYAITRETWETYCAHNQIPVETDSLLTALLSPQYEHVSEVVHRLLDVVVEDEERAMLASELEAEREIGDFTVL